jgi:hypothetical protein
MEDKVSEMLNALLTDDLAQGREPAAGDVLAALTFKRGSSRSPRNQRRSTIGKISVQWTALFGLPVTDDEIRSIGMFLSDTLRGAAICGYGFELGAAAMRQSSPRQANAMHR